MPGAGAYTGFVEHALLNASAVGCLVWLAAARPPSADVQLTIQDGRVSLVAKDATVRQILAEWARVGQTKIVNVERIPGGPVTLQLTDVPEQQALDMLLRSVSGYLAAPRAIAAVEPLALRSHHRHADEPPPRAAAGAARRLAAAGVRAAHAGRRRTTTTTTTVRRRSRCAAGSESRAGLQHVPAAAGRRTRSSAGRAAAVPLGGAAVRKARPPASAGAPATLRRRRRADRPAGTPSSPFGGVSVPGMIVPAPTQQQQPGTGAQPS